MTSQEYLQYGLIGGIILMASLHGLLLAVIFFFSKRLRSRANRFLALSLAGMCVILGYEFAYWLGAENSILAVIEFMPLYIRSTIPMGIFCFATFLINPDHVLTRLERLGYVAIALEVVVALLYLFASVLLADEAKLTRAGEILDIAGEVVGLIASIFLVLLAMRRVNRYQRYLYDHYSSTQHKSLGWLRSFLLVQLFTVGAWLVSFIQYRMGQDVAAEYTFLVVTALLVGSLFWIGYFVVLHDQWFQIVPVAEEVPAPKKKLSAKTDGYHERLVALMTEEKLYEDIDLTLERLSEKLAISGGYLSQIINEKEQKNFFDFVNFYRVEAVKEKLLDNDYSHYTIMGVAMESGFRSKSTFNTIFKKFTGQTPSTFKRLHA